MQFGVVEKFTSAYLFQIAREKSCDNLLIIYVQKFQTNTGQLVFILPHGVINTLRLQESNWSKRLSSYLYFVACFCFWYYPLSFELRCCCFQEIKPVRYFAFLFLFFKATCQSFLISFCTNFVFLHSSLLNLGLTEMLSANQDAEIFVCML